MKANNKENSQSSGKKTDTAQVNTEENQIVEHNNNNENNLNGPGPKGSGLWLSYLNPLSYSYFQGSQLPPQPEDQNNINIPNTNKNENNNNNSLEIQEEETEENNSSFDRANQRLKYVEDIHHHEEEEKNKIQQDYLMNTLSEEEPEPSQLSTGSRFSSFLQATKIFSAKENIVSNLNFPQLQERIGNFLSYAKIPFSAPFALSVFSRKNSSKPSEDPDHFYSKVYQDFLNKIQTESGQGLLKQMDQFVKEFPQTQKNLNEEGQGKIVHEFVEKLQEYYCLEGLNLFSQAETQFLDECFEQYITEKIFPYIFCPVDAYIEKDLWFSDRFSRLSFLKPKHFDLDDTFNLCHFEEAKEELMSINNFKSPRDKMNCILKAAKKIVLKVQQLKNKTIGADDFLPILIYILLNSRIPNIYSNMMYIQYFRDPKQMFGDSGYFFISFLTAVTYLETVTASMLTINEEYFERKLQSYDTISQKFQKKKKKDQHPTFVPHQNETESTASDWVWISSEDENARYLNEKVFLDHLNLDHEKKTCFTWLDKKPEQFTVNDVAELLSEYQRLKKKEEDEISSKK